jgi:hypothetical protein
VRRNKALFYQCFTDKHKKCPCWVARGIVSGRVREPGISYPYQ